MIDYARNEAKAAAKQYIRGRVTGPLLPTDADGNMDEAGFRHNIRHCIDEVGSTVLYINSFYQYYWILTIEERIRVTEIVVDEVAGQIPIIDRVAHPSPREAIKLAKRSEELGTDFLSLVLPPFAANRDVLFGYFKMIADETNLGITLFNTLQSGYAISPTDMAALAEIPNVCALKNNLPLEHTREIRRLVGDDIVVIDPDEEHLLANLKDGQQALYSGTSLMFDSGPKKPLKAYMDAGMAGDFDEAERLFYDMEPLREVHRKWVLERWGEHNGGLCPVATVHHWCSLVGMVAPPPPAPLPQLSEQEKEQLREDLIKVDLISG